MFHPDRRKINQNCIKCRAPDKTLIKYNKIFQQSQSISHHRKKNLFHIITVSCARKKPKSRKRGHWRMKLSVAKIGQSPFARRRKSPKVYDRWVLPGSKTHYRQCHFIHCYHLSLDFKNKIFIFAQSTLKKKKVKIRKNKNFCLFCGFFFTRIL